MRIAVVALLGLVFATGLGFAAHVIARDTVALPVASLDASENLAPAATTTESTTTTQRRRSRQGPHRHHDRTNDHDDDDGRRRGQARQGPRARPGRRRRLERLRLGQLR